MPRAPAWAVVLSLLSAGLAMAQEDASGQSTIWERSPSTIGKIRVENARYFFAKSEELEFPVVSFSVFNGSKLAIRRLYLRGVIRTPGRAVPWIDGAIDYTVPGGIEPGETKHFVLRPDVASDWPSVSKTIARTAAFTLAVTAIEDAKGERIND